MKNGGPIAILKLELDRETDIKNKYLLVYSWLLRQPIYVEGFGVYSIGEKGYLSLIKHIQTKTVIKP